MGVKCQHCERQAVAAVITEIRKLADGGSIGGWTAVCSTHLANYPDYDGFMLEKEHHKMADEVNR